MSGFTLPTFRPITQPWGAEFDDWDGDGIVDYPGGFYHSIGWNGHNGIDYGCFTGDPIEAVADGVVSFAGDAGNWHRILSGGGKAVLIEHTDYGVQTEYLHLSRWAVQAGQAVGRGQVIGYSGATGAATAPHLHLGMLRLTGYNLNDRWRGRIDPTPYLYGGIAAQGSITIPQEDDMASFTDDIIKDKDGGLTTPEKTYISLDEKVTRVEDKVNVLLEAIGSAVKFTAIDGSTVTLAEQLRSLDNKAELERAENVALRAALDAVKATSGATPEQINDSIKAALSNFSVTLSNGGK